MAYFFFIIDSSILPCDDDNSSKIVDFYLFDLSCFEGGATNFSLVGYLAGYYFDEDYFALEIAVVFFIWFMNWLDLGAVDYCLPL